MTSRSSDALLNIGIIKERQSDCDTRAYPNTSALIMDARVLIHFHVQEMSLKSFQENAYAYRPSRMFPTRPSTLSLSSIAALTIRFTELDGHHSISLEVAPYLYPTMHPTVFFLEHNSNKFHQKICSFYSFFLTGERVLMRTVDNISPR